MVTREDNDLLTRVEGDWPMGQIMRRHWLPACLSEEVAEPDGPPVRTRMLGEDLVVFRDTQGTARRFSASTACTAAPRSPSAATRNAGCAASITAGNSTLTAMSWTRPASPTAAA